MSQSEITNIQLDFPIQDGNGNTITELNVRRAKVKDIRKMQQQKNESEQEVFLLHLLTGVLPEDLDKMDISDYAKLQTVIKDMTVGKVAT